MGIVEPTLILLTVVDYIYVNALRVTEELKN